ncbi:MAG: TrkA family potassium uptake protein [Chloroflexi bacterium]|nr:TrkA family potassium uptake protein [Chloroflexota bacterium]
MKAIIVGCGRVGARLAMTLHVEGHDVTIVDKDRMAFERLSGAYGGKKRVGIGFDRKILVESGIETADAFASLTNGDNTNIISAIIAKHIFHVSRVVTRIKDPERAQVYRRIGIPTISPTIWGSDKVREMFLYSGLTSHYTFGSGEIELVAIEVKQGLAGRKVADLVAPAEIVVVALTRAGSSSIPPPETVFEPGDIVHIAASASAKSRLEAMVH